MTYNTHTLPSGLRIIHRPSPSPVVYCGYQIAAGTRDELPGEEGLAHFCEHMTFKGTARRTSMQILNALESVGGDLNAFTNKETTVYYAAILKEHLHRAIDVLTDIVFNSTYPQHEIDKEIEVICDEIESYNDSPAELIYDEFENILFEGHPLGHNILGQADRLRQYTTADALRFVRRHYRPANAIFFVYGDVEFAKLVKWVEREELRVKSEEFATAPENFEVYPSAAANSSLFTLHSSLKNSSLKNTFILDRSTHQSHVMLGTRGYDIHSDRRMPLYVLNNLLGGPGMNARLNIALRERHGLVYTVESTMTCYKDTGTWCIYFGCDHEDVRRCLRLVRRELDRVMQKPLSSRQLAAAKQQLKGQIGVACDNRENFALDFGKSFLHYGWEKDIYRLYENIDQVTADQIQTVAQELFAPERLTTLIIR